MKDQLLRLRMDLAGRRRFLGLSAGKTLWTLNKDRSAAGPLFLAGDYMVYPTLGGAAMSAYNAVEKIEAWA